MGAVLALKLSAESLKVSGREGERTDRYVTARARVNHRLLVWQFLFIYSFEIDVVRTIEVHDELE